VPFTLQELMWLQADATDQASTVSVQLDGFGNSVMVQSPLHQAIEETLAEKKG
jgi:hypothetical protein